MRWIGTGLAVAVAVYVTQSISPLWFMLIPAAIDILCIASTQNIVIGDED